MHCHLYEVSVSIIPTAPPTPHPTPYTEHDIDLTYEPPSTLPIVSCTIHTIPNKLFRVKCRREGNASDVDATDLAFEVFLDDVWIGHANLKSAEAISQSKPVVDLLLTAKNR